MLRRFSLGLSMAFTSFSLWAALPPPAPAVATPPDMNTNDGFMTVALFDFEGPVMKVCPFGTLVIKEKNKRVCGQLDTWHIKDGTQIHDVTMQQALDMHFGVNKTIMVGTAPFNYDRAVIFYKIIKTVEAPVIVDKVTIKKSSILKPVRTQ